MLFGKDEGHLPRGVLSRPSDIAPTDVPPVRRAPAHGIPTERARSSGPDFLEHAVATANEEELSG